MESYKKRGELNELGRRKMARRELLNYRLELERHRGLVASQRMYALRHLGGRMVELRNMIRKIEGGYY